MHLTGRRRVGNFMERRRQDRPRILRGQAPSLARARSRTLILRDRRRGHTRLDRRRRGQDRIRQDLRPRRRPIIGGAGTRTPLLLA